MQNVLLGPGSNLNFMVLGLIVGVIIPRIDNHQDNNLLLSYGNLLISVSQNMKIWKQSKRTGI